MILGMKYLTMFWPNKNRNFKLVLTVAKMKTSILHEREGISLRRLLRVKSSSFSWSFTVVKVISNNLAPFYSKYLPASTTTIIISWLCSEVGSEVNQDVAKVWLLANFAGWKKTWIWLIFYKKNRKKVQKSWLGLLVSGIGVF